jgi:hypothetical protein
MAADQRRLMRLWLYCPSAVYEKGMLRTNFSRNGGQEVFLEIRSLATAIS